MLAKFVNSLPLFWQQLLVYCLISLLPIILLLPWLYQHNQQQLVQLKSEQLLLIAQEKFYQMNLYLQAQKSFVQQLANTPNVIEILHQSDIELYDQQALIQTTNNFLQQHQHENLFIISPAGKLLFAAHHHMALGEYLTTEDWKESALSALYQEIQPKPMVLGYRWDEIEGQLIGLISAPIIYEGETIGYLAIQLNKTWLNQFVEQRQGLGETGEINIGYQRADGSARPLTPTRYNDFNSKQREALAGEPIPLEKAISGQIGWGESFDYRGEPVIAAWLYEPETHLGVVVKQDKKELFHVIQTQKLSFLVILTLLIFVIILLTHRESRKQARIIQQLVRQAERLGTTDATTPIPQSIGMAPELQQLSSALDLADRQIKEQLTLLARQAQLLESQSERLKDANSDLELKINQKTAELNEYIKIVDDHVIISRTDLEGKITYASNAFCRVSGYQLAELVGQNHRIIKHPNNPPALFEELWNTITSGQTWHGEIQNMRKDGSIYWVNTNISPTYDTETGKITGYMAVREDITDRKRAESLSITDEMTQLYNRRYFNEQFDQLWRVAARSGELLMLIMIDVDHFKNYNDLLGHHQGDLALIAVAKAIKSASRRATDYTFRLGGEEMAVLAIVKHPEDGVLLAEQIQQHINELAMPHPKNSAAEHVTVSIGLCYFDGRDCQRASDPNLNGLYQLADKALYQAKEAGRNRIIACLEGLSCVSTSGQHSL